MKEKMLKFLEREISVANLLLLLRKQSGGKTMKSGLNGHKA